MTMFVLAFVLSAALPSATLGCLVGLRLLVGVNASLLVTFDELDEDDKTGLDASLVAASLRKVKNDEAEPCLT